MSDRCKACGACKECGAPQNPYPSLFPVWPTYPPYYTGDFPVQPTTWGPKYQTTSGSSTNIC